MMQHSLLGASGASRWLACPGSFKLSQAVTPAPPSIYAATGTVAHILIEEAIKNKFCLLPNLFGQVRSVDGVDVLIDHEMLDAVQIMLDYARSRLAPKRLFKSEMRVFPHLPFKPPVDVFGSLDLVIADVFESWFEIIDYKHGAGVPVKAERNAQLLYYAAGAYAALHQGAPGAKFDEVRLTIVQPRIPGQAVIKQWAISLLDLELWVYDVLVPGIEACLDAFAPLVPGEHCRFCPAIAGCPALLWKAQAAAKNEFDDYTGENPAMMSLSEKLALADQLEVWMNALRDDAKRRLEDGEHIPGWRVVPTRPTRKWTNEVSAAYRLTQQLGLPRDELFKREMLSPAQMEKAFAKKVGSAQWDKTMRPLIQAVSS